jgi:LuxR family transcriptional regulator of csgAB operon
VLFCASGADAFTTRALQHGAMGCLTTPSEHEQCLRAIRAVHAGEFWATRKVLGNILTGLLLAPEQHARESDDELRDNLSDREYEIVFWMHQCMSNKEIGRKLSISDMTVKTHVHNIFRKLKVSGRLRLFQQFSRRQPSPTY